jgi:regulator of sigma E protease
VSDVGDVSAWQPLRSMMDLQWQLTQAVLNGQDLHLQVRRLAQPESNAPELVRLRTSEIPAAEVDASLMERIGLSGPYTVPRIARVLPDGPAEQAGLQSGDQVLSLDGREPGDAAQLRQWIAAGPVQDARALPVRMVVARGQQQLALTVAPILKDDQGKQVARIMAEIGSPPETVVVHYGALEGLQKAGERTWEVSILTLNMLGKMLVGQASIKNLSGPITIADYAGKSAEMGWTHFLGFLALVSISLGVLNLLPLPVLDGGHLMYYLFEALTGRPVSDVWLERLQRAGVAVMLLMMSLALYNDFARLLGVH